MQKYEFNMAQQQDLHRKRQREEAEKRQKEEEEKVIKKSVMRKKAIKNNKELLPPEPNGTDPNICEIAFRLPKGERVVRRFLKTNTIQALYAYISLTKDLEDGTYEISQPVPRKVYSDVKATLEQEGLAPRATVQVVMLDLDD